MSVKHISEYVSTNEKRTSSVYKVLETGEYKVSVMNESGSSFSSTFWALEDAENFAEDWVLQK